ncbi:GTPase [Sphaerisporangium sp. NPDC051011]|uniref:GTPase n=1 Tax=Sphaerisporangium sp. NPDC051011 TaxID=3155792 RepID=UPI0033F6E647
MKVLRRTKGVSLDDRLAALAEAADLAEGRLDWSAVAGAHAVVARAGARRNLSVDHTVVALAGATGSGKSSLFNTLSGTSLARVGVTRPTTSAAHAAMWDPEGAGPLLDWLDIPRRHTVDGADTWHPPVQDDSVSAGGPFEQGQRASAERPASASLGAGADRGRLSSLQAGQDNDPLSGLILLDLPDHDSIELAHRLEVDRLVAVVDLLVWVLDPQKYADAAVHERYLRPLSRHRDVMMVVLNQTDRLTPSAVKRCLNDLRRLLDEDGLRGVPVLATSVPRDEGIGEVRSALAARVADRRTWASRLAADALLAADLLAAASSGPAPLPPAPAGTHPPPASPAASQPPRSTPSPESVAELGRRARAAEQAVTGELAAPLTDALAEAAGVPLVVDAVAKAHRHRSIVATGWPVTRWLRRFRPDPLRRLRVGIRPGAGPMVSSSHGMRGSPQDALRLGASPESRSLDSSRSDDLGTAKPGPGPGGLSAGPFPGKGGEQRRGIPAGGVPLAIGRTSIPPATAIQRSQMDMAIRDVASAAASGLPEPWTMAVRRASRARADELADRLDRAVSLTFVGAGRQPRWWRAAGFAQWLAFAAMITGLLWLSGLFLVDYMRLPEVPTPTLGVVPWPTVLLAGGAAAGILIALLCRVLASLSARRRARKARKALWSSVDMVGHDLVLTPIRAELTRAHDFAAALTKARS